MLPAPGAICPHHRVTHRPKAPHLLAERGRVALPHPSLAMTTMAPRARPLPPPREERGEVLGELGPAGPAGDGVADRDEGPVGVAARSGRVIRVSRVPSVKTSTGIPLRQKTCARG